MYTSTQHELMFHTEQDARRRVSAGRRPARRLSGSRRGWVAAVGAAMTVAVMAIPTTVAAEPPDRQPMHDIQTGEAKTGTFSHLVRDDDGVASRIRTSGTAGHAVTAWYVIFNEPGQCASGACGADDIFVLDEDGQIVTDDDGQPVLNEVQIEATRLSIVFAEAGRVVNPGGRLRLDGGLAVGDVPDGSVPVAVGHPDHDPVLGPGPVTGLEDARRAEIHVVLQDHGPAHGDPDLLHQQLTGFMTACNPDCADVQFAVHQ